LLATQEHPRDGDGQRPPCFPPSQSSGSRVGDFLVDGDRGADLVACARFVVSLGDGSSVALVRSVRASKPPRPAVLSLSVARGQPSGSSAASLALGLLSPVDIGAVTHQFTPRHWFSPALRFACPIVLILANNLGQDFRVVRPRPFHGHHQELEIVRVFAPGPKRPPAVTLGFEWPRIFPPYEHTPRQDNDQLVYSGPRISQPLISQVCSTNRSAS
jgi:hypothetical protein